MTIKLKPLHIHWTLYAKSGDVEIWKGHPHKGNWIQWECRNDATREIRQVTEQEAPFTLNEMLNNHEL